MRHCNDILVFLLDGRRYAISLDAVERVLRAVEIDPVPMAPEAVRGLLNIQGRIIPVLNIRTLFRLPGKDQDLNDRLIVVRTKERVVAFPADDVSGVFDGPENGPAARGAVLPEVECLEGVLALDDGMVLIYDLDRFLSSEECAAFTHHPAPAGGPAAAAENQGESYD